MPIALESFAESRWIGPGANAAEIRSAIDGRLVATASSSAVDFGAMVRYARTVGGPALRRMTFHGRAALLKQLATMLTARKEELHELAFDTGATRTDSWVDIDGGLITLAFYASRGRRELPDEHFLVEGAPESLSKGGRFWGGHVLVPREGVAVHVNAYNFPCWGLLEKLAPSLLAGVPVITKPATATAYVAHAMARMIVGSDILPPGSFQFVAGGAGDLLDHLTGQDVLSFTGSAETSGRLRDHPTVSRTAVRFVAERDSLNAAVLGTDAGPGSPEFDLFVREVVREMTVKAGQKCTAIRRVIVPRQHEQAVAAALRDRLERVVVGDPRRPDVDMGPVVSPAQRDEVRRQVTRLRTEAEVVSGDGDGSGPNGGAFMAPVLLHCSRPMQAAEVHRTEAFGPVATMMPYDDLGEAVTLVQRGEGSLVASIYTHDADIAAALTFGLAPFHGRLLLLDRDCAAESTGHGSPLPGLVHGGPGRAGGGEELGGLRGVHHYMQRTALQASPARMAALTKRWVKGAPEHGTPSHPFRLDFDALTVGDTVHTASRVVTLEDIETFCTFHRRYLLRPYGRGGSQGEPVLPGPRRTWLPDPGIRGRPVRRSGPGAVAGQLWAGHVAVPAARYRRAMRSECGSRCCTKAPPGGRSMARCVGTRRCSTNATRRWRDTSS